MEGLVTSLHTLTCGNLLKTYVCSKSIKFQLICGMHCTQMYDQCNDCESRHYISSSRILLQPLTRDVHKGKLHLLALGIKSFPHFWVRQPYCWSYPWGQSGNWGHVECIYAGYRPFITVSSPHCSGNCLTLRNETLSLHATWWSYTYFTEWIVTYLPQPILPLKMRRTI